ncbi:hypothetical protein [Flavobacterium sp. ov086]|uniref:hypothetical protein n=1 Tax=Flavobacterium sp. ov086 TaxID=1761785 RepID=UPI000B691D50|nr:hypothetical protein [Flavobacterium sp. ov086]SNS02408.1 hypothetical protein SAMN04487979_1458 [Flavobacterium sp. ov086]
MNKDYLIVFSPKDTKKYINKRFLVSINQLKKYIGLENANKAVLKAETLDKDKLTLKYRSYGKIEIYLK